MKKYIIYSFIAGLLLVTAACKKDLNINNPNTPTVTAFWKTQSDALAGVNSVYSTLHRGSISRWQLFANIIRSDEGTSTSPDHNLQNNFDLFLITDYNYGNTTGIWADNYIGIFRANQVLDNVPNITMDATLKNQYLGEAKFMRGYFYYNLAMLFGNVPLQLKTSVTNDQIATSPRDAVWAQVVKDLTEAVEVLPPSYSNPNDLGRATKGAAYAMLAKAYMQQRKFAEAIPALAYLADGPGKGMYGLTDDYRDNFLESKENNKESVFEIQFATNPLDNHDDDTDPRVDNLNYGQSLPPFFAPKPIGFTDGQGLRWVIHEFTKEKTVAGGRDPRVDASYLYDSTDVRGPNFSMIYGQTFASRYPGGNTDVWFRKYLDDAIGTGESFHSGNNYRIIRYADVLLMYAECLNETGKTTDAYKYVDAVRQRAGLATLTSAKPGMNHDAFLTQLKHERLTELAGEGHRWDDLSRWGDLGKNLADHDPAFNNFVKNKSELFPIPQVDLDSDPNLKQNPNY